MKSTLCLLLLSTAAIAGELPPAGDYTVSVESPYNTLTMRRTGSIVEMRSTARQVEFIETAVDLEEPTKLIAPYTRTFFGAAFLQPDPKRVLMVGLGGGAFHRLFSVAYPGAVLQTVELDPKVYELSQSHMGFQPTEKTPVAIADGRIWIKQNRDEWDWIILDAFRADFVPPHLKTQEFYQECSARLSARGVLITNLQVGTKLFYADLRTLTTAFPQVLIMQTATRHTVVALAVKYTQPNLLDPANWLPAAAVQDRFGDHLDMASVRREFVPVPVAWLPDVITAAVLTDDFSPVEMLQATQANNTLGLNPSD